MFYMLLIGGTFDATLRFQVQLLNAGLAGVLAILWLTLRIKQKGKLRFTGLEWPLLAFSLSQWIATATSAQPRLSLEAAINVTAWSIAFLIVCDIFRDSWPRTYVINALLIAGGLIAAQGLWEVGQWFAQWAALEQLPPAAYRLTGFLGHPNLTTVIINLLLPLVIAQLIRVETSNRPQRLALGGLGLSLLAAEFFTSSRAGWIAGAATLSVMAVLLAWPKRERWSAWVANWQSRPWPMRLTVLGVGLSGLFLVSWLLIRQTSHVTHGSLFLSRQEFWGPAWTLFTTQPLTGTGPDLYPWFYPALTPASSNWLPPHAHSLIFQILSSSGLLGLGALLLLAGTAGLKLWRVWQNAADKTLAAALISSLIGFSLHHLFDYFFGTPVTAFFLLILGALAVALDESPSPKIIPPLSLAFPLALVGGLTAFSLRGAALNAQGLALADKKEWAAAGQAFQRAAETDPGLTLYWEEAAQAFTRAGEVSAAIPLWQRAAQDEPDWPVPQAVLAVLTHNPAAMQPALNLAYQNYLLTLNAGALFEAAGETATARAEYEQALTLNPALSRALFWKQTSLRADLLASWQATQPRDSSALAQGWAALKAGEAEHARQFFVQAQVEAPLSNRPYLGLAQADWALGNKAQAERDLRVGQNLPVAFIGETIDFYLLEGDWASAQGQRREALEKYTLTFSAIADYTMAGPGTYGYPRRSWIVFHRAALPSDLVPQFAHADITAEIDERLAQLAQWYVEDQQPETACFILERVYREVPNSKSGKLRQELCH